MLTEASRFCLDMLAGSEPRWLSLLGTSGAGKSHLSAWILRFFQCRVQRHFIHGKAGYVLSERTASYRDWRRCSARFKNQEWDLVDAICEDWLCVLDDIGAEHDPNSFAASKLDEICNRRLGKWTVITSNLQLEQISAQMDPRIASRLLRGGNVVVGIDTEDYALRMRKGKAA
jgi:DNA replication protein DnaC